MDESPTGTTHYGLYMASRIRRRAARAAAINVGPMHGAKIASTRVGGPVGSGKAGR